MKRRVRLTALAERDLIGIWTYSAAQWDEAQADRYLDQFEKAMGALEENPDLGAKRDYVREGYRVLFVGRHAIWYKMARTAIRVMRVLHGQMDPEHHL